MSTRVIAILSHNIASTLHWFCKSREAEIDQIRYAQRTIFLKNGDRYVICNENQQLYGLMIDDYILSPQYKPETLEDIAKTRLYRKYDDGAKI